MADNLPQQLDLAVENPTNPTDDSASYFSGRDDAFSTFFVNNHLEEDIIDG